MAVSSSSRRGTDDAFFFLFDRFWHVVKGAATSSSIVLWGAAKGELRERLGRELQLGQDFTATTLSRNIMNVCIIHWYTKGPKISDQSRGN